MKRQVSFTGWFNSGEPYIWLNAGAVSVSIIMVTGLIVLIMVRGLGHFWPSDVAAFDYTDSDGSVIALAGELSTPNPCPGQGWQRPTVGYRRTWTSLSGG